MEGPAAPEGAAAEPTRLKAATAGAAAGAAAAAGGAREALARKAEPE